MGSYIQSQPYKKADPLILPSPVVFLESKPFYIRWSQLGVYFMGGENWGASLIAQPRPYGYEAHNSAQLRGMAERKSSWEGGISFAAKNDYAYVQIAYLHDLLDNSNGSLVRGELGTKQHLGKWTFVPSLLLLHFSQSFNNYYYGVTQDEATLSRSYYKAQAGLNIALQSYIDYEFAPKWHLFSNLRIDILNDAITDSPIVNDRYMYSGLVSLLYDFNF